MEIAGENGYDAAIDIISAADRPMKLSLERTVVDESYWELEEVAPALSSLQPEEEEEDNTDENEDSAGAAAAGEEEKEESSSMDEEAEVRLAFVGGS